MKIEDATVVETRVIFARLAAKFTGNEVKSRRQSGRDLQYITARTVMNRLDDVLGPENWWDEYTPMENAVICRLTIQLPSGQMLTKSDAGGFTTTADTSDYEKTGFSDAFKRAAVKFGVGRHLYGDGVPSYAQEEAPRQSHDRDSYYSASREREYEPDPETRRRPSHQSNGDGDDERFRGSAPRSGKGLFAWVKEKDEKTGSDLLRGITEWGKSQGFPARMVQWSDEEVHRGHTEAMRRLDEPESNGSQRSNVHAH